MALVISTKLASHDGLRMLAIAFVGLAGHSWRKNHKHCIVALLCRSPCSVGQARRFRGAHASCDRRTEAIPAEVPKTESDTAQFVFNPSVFRICGSMNRTDI